MRAGEPVFGAAPIVTGKLPELTRDVYKAPAARVLDSRPLCRVLRARPDPDSQRPGRGSVHGHSGAITRLVGHAGA
jgi:hypothetical protein